MQLLNKRILLTGATGGLGQAIALALAKKGAIIGLVGRDHQKLQTLKLQVEQAGGQASCIAADLSQPNASQQLANHASNHLGYIDIVIHNAGVLDFIQLQDQSDARIAEMIHTNVTAVIQLTRALLPDFLAKNKGQWVFVGSIFGSMGFPHFATYSASKFAVHGFSQALRRELVDTAIGVTYIAPRGIDTPMNDANVAAMWKKSGNAVDAPEKVAQLIVMAIEKEQQEVFIGQPQSFFAWMNGVLPAVVNNGLKKQTALAQAFLKQK
ncbi:MAG TPA: SDR family oxidoreductase [Methylophilus sp.]